MKAFRFTLEAVRTVRQRRENEALEEYSKSLAARQQVLDAVAIVEEQIARDFEHMRKLLTEGCSASAASQSQTFHLSLEKKRDELLAALGAAERRVNAASRLMLAARQQREIVDIFRDKQVATYQREELREEQKALDEFAGRRSTALTARSNHE
jgi:flagellar export protein FliJ